MQKRRQWHILEERKHSNEVTWKKNKIWPSEKKWWVITLSMTMARDQSTRKGHYELRGPKKRRTSRREGGVKWGKLELDEGKDRKNVRLYLAPADKTGQISYRTLSSPFIEPSLPPLLSCPSAEKLITRATHLSLRQPAQSQRDATKK